MTMTLKSLKVLVLYSSSKDDGAINHYIKYLKALGAEVEVSYYPIEVAKLGKVILELRRKKEFFDGILVYGFEKDKVLKKEIPRGKDLRRRSVKGAISFNKFLRRHKKIFDGINILNRNLK